MEDPSRAIPSCTPGQDLIKVPLALENSSENSSACWPSGSACQAVLYPRGLALLHHAAHVVELPGSSCAICRRQFLPQLRSHPLVICVPTGRAGLGGRCVVWRARSRPQVGWT